MNRWLVGAGVALLLAGPGVAVAVPAPRWGGCPATFTFIGTASIFICRFSTSVLVSLVFTLLLWLFRR